MIRLAAFFKNFAKIAKCIEYVVLIFTILSSKNGSAVQLDLVPGQRSRPGQDSSLADEVSGELRLFLWLLHRVFGCVDAAQ